jgi:hypothetical protein
MEDDIISRDGKNQPHNYIFSCHLDIRKKFLTWLNIHLQLYKARSYSLESPVIKLCGYKKHFYTDKIEHFFLLFI